MKKQLLILSLMLCMASAALANAGFTQGSWRWRKDVGPENDATNWLAAERTPITLNNIDDQIRLRIETLTNGDNASGSHAFQYEITPGVWRTITAQDQTLNQPEAFIYTTSSNGLASNLTTTQQLAGYDPFSAFQFGGGQTLVGINNAFYNGSPKARYEYEMVIKPTGYMEPNKAYRFRLWGSNSTYPEDIPMPSVVAPSITYANVVSKQPVNHQDHSITLSGEVISANGAEVTARGWIYLEYDANQILNLNNGNQISLGAGVGTFNHRLTNLPENIRYMARTYATNSLGTSYGKIVIINSLPRVKTFTVNDIRYQSARVVSQIISTGSTPIRDYGIVYSETNPLPHINDRESTIRYSSNLDGTTYQNFLSNLSPNTRYYVRSFTANEAGFSQGDINSFTTLPKLTFDITTPAGAYDSVTDANPIPFTITFSEDVVDFRAEHINVSNGSLSDFSGSGATYTFNVTPSQDPAILSRIAATNSTTTTANTAPSSSSQSQVQVVVSLNAYVTETINETPNEGGSFRINYVALLPVELLNFSARAENNRTKLQWTTSTEKDNNHFEIERASNGGSFKKLANVAAKGNAITQTTYTWYDNAPINGTNYYRLKQVDHDGKTSTLGDRFVSFQLSNAVNAIVYPNPVKDQINLILPNYLGNTIQVNITDISGKKVHQQTLQTSTDQASYTLSPKSKLPSGQYIISVSGQTFSQQLKIIVL